MESLLTDVSRQNGEAAARRCPACAHSSSAQFFEIPSVPVHCNILWPTAEAARSAPRGTIKLAVCDGCGLVFNVAFDQALVTYDGIYENSLHYSPRFEAYAEALAQDLSTRLGLRGQLVVEVGCGKGEFLRRLCRTAGARGLGIDASYDPTIGADDDDSGTVTFVREPFNTLSKDLQPSLVFCRHVLEHLPEARAFVQEFADVARRVSGCRVFLEVPNVLFTLRDRGIWDLIYEHCLYFSAPSLASLCETAGLAVDRVYPAYGDQFLCAEAHAAAATPRDWRSEVREIRELATGFADEYQTKLRHWQERLAELARDGRVVALWGAGSKGITFVNTVPGGSAVAGLVDLNPRKQGRFVPGTGQPVVSPETLVTMRPDIVIVMNPLYQQEISGQLRELGLNCTVEVA
jgi:SAM-dependent methyltransferase